MNALAVITFAAPAMLWGIAGVTAPIAAHLLAKRASRRIVFPSVWLLRDAAAGRARLRRFRSWSLLVLRVIAVIALTLAFAQPLWPGAMPPADEGASTAVVFVLDNSASSGQLIDGVEALHHLRSAADREAAGLDDDDPVGLVLAAPVRAAWPGLTTGTALLSEKLAELAPSASRADIAGAVRTADELLREHRGPKRIVVLSDRQATNWDGIRLESEAPVRVVGIAAGRSDNVALRNPAAWPATPRARRPITLTVELANYGTRPASVSVGVAVDGRSVSAESVSVEPRAMRQVSFQARLPAGFHEVAFTIPPDALIIDNRVSLSLIVAERATVAVVGNEDAVRVGTGSYFLRRALSPRGEQDAVHVVVATPTSLTAANLNGVNVVFASLSADTSDAAIDALRTLVGRGGSLVLLCGPDADPAEVGRLHERLAPEGGLPWLPQTLHDAGGLSIRSIPDTGPWLLNDFDATAQRTLGRVRFKQVWSVAAPAPDATTLLDFSDDTPALSERRVGAGRVVMANFDASPRSGDLATRGIFPALVHALVEGLQPPPDNVATAIAGGAVVFPFDASSLGASAGGVEIVMPDGERSPATWSLADGQMGSQVDAPTPGTYRLARGETTLAAVSAYIDPRESDLVVADSSSVQSLTYAQTAREPASLGVQERAAQLWPWLLGLATAALAVELLALVWWRA
jgi:hypothetical protein